MPLLDKPSRRDFLISTATTAAAASLVSLLPHGRRPQSQVAPNDTNTLGVIGIGPRCTYDLKAMLPIDDVRCVAIADVQASRRDAGKSARRRPLRQQRLPALSRLSRTARPQRYRRRAHRHRRPLARRGLDPGRRGRQGRVQREALRHHDRRLPEAGRHDAPREAYLSGRHAAPQRAELSEGG